MRIKNRVNILDAKSRSQRVDADDAFDIVVVLGFSKQRQSVGACRVFVFGRDAILQLDTNNIGAGR